MRIFLDKIIGIGWAIPLHACNPRRGVWMATLPGGARVTGINAR